MRMLTPAVVALLAVLAMHALSPAAADEIYKTYDEDGNPVYTDEAPSDGARPMELPELNVLEPGEEAPVDPAETAPSGEGGLDTSDQLELAFVTPGENDQFTSDMDALAVEVAASMDVPGNPLLVLYLNDEELPAVQGMATAIEEVPPGEHTLRAELRTETGHVLASSDPVNFQVHQVAGDDASPD